MQVKKAVRRADALLEDHRHELPNGEFTSGMLAKPSKDQFGMHSHLYEFEEDTVETGPMHNLPGHDHSSAMGRVSGPMGMQKKPGEPWHKMDSLQREGADYVLRSSTGSIIGRGHTAVAAMKHYDVMDIEEHVAKGAFSNVIGEDVDEAKWNKAKEASKASVGSVKWPLVQHIYQNMGGK